MNDSFDRLINSVILESYWNFPNGLFNYIQAYAFSRLKLLFNFYVKRTVHRQDFGAKFRLTYHNGASVEDILKKIQRNSCILIQLFLPTCLMSRRR